MRSRHVSDVSPVPASCVCMSMMGKEKDMGN